VAVEWYNRDQSVTKSQARSESGRYLRESFEMFQEIVRVRINQTRGLYDHVAKPPPSHVG
jgi:hypothetical protein